MLGGPAGAAGGGYLGGKYGDKLLGPLGGGDPLGDFLGGGPGLSTPQKSDFQYSGKDEGYFQNRGEQLYGRAPVQANLDQFNQSRQLGMQSRQGIDAQMKRIGALANDEKASQAYWQMKAGGAQNMMQALALARSGGGSGAAQGAALRQAQMGNMQAGQGLNQQIGMMRAQEVAQANQQMAGLAAQQRAFDLQAAGLDAQTAMQQAQLELGSQQMGMQGLLGMYGLGQNAAALDQKGGMEYWKTLLGAEAAQAQAAAQQKAGLMGAGAAMGSAAILAPAMSDENAKMSITPIGGQLGMQFGQQPMLFGQPLQSNQVSSGITGKMNVAPIPDYRSAGGTVIQNPGQPAIRTAGGMQMDPGNAGEAIGKAYDAKAKSDYSRGMWAYDMSQKIGQAVGSAYRPAPFQGLAEPEQYLPTISDARAKKLEDENARLKVRVDATDSLLGQLRGAAMGPPVAQRFGEAVGTAPAMRHLPVPQVPAFQPRNELEAAQYGNRWLEQNRADAMRDAAAQEQYRKEVQAQQDALAYNQALAGQTDAMQDYRAQGGTVTSDESAKRLRGMLDSATDRLLQYEDAYGPIESRASAAFGAGHDGVTRPGPRPLAAQARAIPAYSWQYDPQHAAQANVKNGQPPNAPFGQMQKVGPMAQDLQRIPALRGAVSPGPDGMLQVDGGQAAMTGLSMVGDVARQAAEQEERLRRLEQMYPKNIDDPSMFWGPGF